MAVIGALRELNAAQEAAVAHDRGPLLILAGAGTGKTRVLVERYRRLRQEGVGAQAILLLTFTDKAAREMLDRIERDDELPSAERWVTTYHAFAQQFVQEHGWLCGLPRTFRIASPVRKWELMGEVLRQQRPSLLFHPQRPHDRPLRRRHPRDVCPERRGRRARRSTARPLHEPRARRPRPASPGREAPEQPAHCRHDPFPAATSSHGPARCRPRSDHRGRCR